MATDDTSIVVDSPWWPLCGGKPSAYAHKGKRYLRRQAELGKLRVVVIGERKQMFTTKAWLDDWMMQHAAPLTVNVRRRA
jgi:hypothetical protein